MKYNFDQVIDRRGTDCKKYAEQFYGEDVLPMWIADTDFRCPEPIVEAVAQRVAHGIFGYPYDQESFAQAVCRWMAVRFGYVVEPDAIEYCPGVIPGVICAVKALSNPGDNIVVQTPCYPPFRALVHNNGRRLLENRLVLKNGRYEIDFSLLEAQLKEPRTRLMLLCNPQNPTGRVFTREELETILRLCVENDVTVICDEIHCDITYADRHIPFGSLSQEARDHSVVFVNPSKTFNIAGFRTAAMIAPNAALCNRVHQELVNAKIFGRTIFGPLTLVKAYTECDDYADQLVDYLRENVAYLNRRLEAMPRIHLVQPEATYLMWLDCRGMELPHSEIKAFFDREARVGLNDGTTFGTEGEGFMRLNLAVPRCVLAEGLDRIENAYRLRFGERRENGVRLP